MVDSASGRMGTTCVFFQTATVAPEVLAEFQRLSRDLPPGWTTRLLLDRSGLAGTSALPHENVVSFDGRRFAEWGLATFGPSLLPGHNHFALLRAFSSEPVHDWYWCIEYDVRFTGSWRRLFDGCAALGADFLTCHLRRYADEPHWYFWHTLGHPEDSVPLAARLRSFNVVMRFSRRALASLHDWHASGWAGHHEVLVPTLLHSRGFEVADFGGDGPFVPPGFRNRYYTSYSTSNGALWALGTVRFRPPRLDAGRRRETLYHPVKPGEAFQPAPRLDKARETIRELGRHLKWRLRRGRWRSP